MFCMVVEDRAVCYYEMPCLRVNAAGNCQPKNFTICEEHWVFLNLQGENASCEWCGSY